MNRKTNYYTDYKGDVVEYMMCSDYDTQGLRAKTSKHNAFAKCGLIDCKHYKTCDLQQIKKDNLKCINYEHFNKF